MLNPMGDTNPRNVPGEDRRTLEAVGRPDSLGVRKYQVDV